MSSTAKQSLKLRFEEIVDKFALRLTDDERERLVQLYDLPPIYFNKSRVQVFRALRMLGIYSHDNPEGLLNIGEVLQRRDIISDFREEIQTHAQNLRKLRHRKSSIIVDLQEIYSKIDLPPTLDLSKEHIEVLKANVRLLEKITNYRYNNDDFRRRRIKFHLENAWQKLTDVADCLALAGDEAVSPTTVQLKAKPILESQPPAVNVSSHDHIAVTEMRTNPAPVFYENIGAGQLGRRGSDPLMTIKRSPVMESTSPKLRRDSVPNQKPASPAPQPKLPHNLHSSHSDSTRSSEQAVGLESPRLTRKPGPTVKPKPTARTETRSVAQHTLKPPAPLPGETSDCSGSGDSGFADDSWPKPHPHPREEAFTAKLEHHYQQLVQSQLKDSFNADDDAYENPQPYKHK